MLEQGCVVTDRWTANRCFDLKEEPVRIKVLRDKVKRGDEEKGRFIENGQRARIRFVSSLHGPVSEIIVSRGPNPRDVIMTGGNVFYNRW